MKPFLDEVAEALYREYGVGISDQYLVFPGKRARLFFNEALLRCSDGRPIWQPHYLSIDDMVRDLSGLESGDQLRLVAELYQVYANYHPGETFDRFYRWGEMLLSDFDTIDKYLIDAEALYANVSDLREIEARFSVLFDGDDQGLQLVVQFWRAFNARTAQSVEQQQFLKIWRSLYEIYTRFKARLREQRIAYSGMIYREVAERLGDEEFTKKLERKTYRFVGFNALNECEQRLFDYLGEQGLARFYWDYDNYYYTLEDQEAGRFVRRNVARFGDRDGTAIPLERDNFRQPKQIEVICAPSDVLQCKALYRQLEQIHRRQGFIDKETAIVLTDESLLLPVLHSIPAVVENLNITMGYPLSSTVPYVLLERLLALQRHRRAAEFALDDVVGLLSHPYVVEGAGAAARRVRQQIETWQSLWVPVEFFAEHELLKKLFRPVDGPTKIQRYVEEILSEFGAVASDSEQARERKEFIFTLLEHIVRLGETVQSCGIELETGTYVSLLRSTLQNVRIPYEGEPLKGLQVMGILETRNLDFDNVILLSVGDDTFPGNRESASYIPFHLRQAFGLPTPQDHEAMYAYYFYRLIARCRQLTMLYSSSADEQRTGEQSRYIYQLEYESPHPVERIHVNLRVDYRPVEPIVVAKTPEVMARIGQLSFSPTAVNHYIDCPLKFYFANLERLAAPEQVSGAATALDVGNTLHRAMELLYEPLVGRPAEEVASALASITSAEVIEVVEQAMEQVLGMRASAQKISGRMQLHCDIIVRYVHHILAYDRRRGPFRIEGLELKAESTLSVDGRPVVLAGRADRLDCGADGVRQVVDYKSGGDKTEFASIEGLFTDNGVSRDGEFIYEPHNGAVLQTMLYALIFAAAQGGTTSSTAPVLYVARRMQADDYSPYPFDRTQQKIVDCLSPSEVEQLTARLEGLFRELLDPTVPFTQTVHRKRCEWCDFRPICRF